MDRELLIQKANDLLDTYGLRLLGWTVEIRKLRSRHLGMCYHGLRVISLDDYYVEHNEESIIRDTILHEIAHALAGAMAGHGPKWKAVAESLGCTARSCRPAGSQIKTRPLKWVATCPNCGKVCYKARLRLRSGCEFVCAACWNQGVKNAKMVFQLNRPEQISTNSA